MNKILLAVVIGATLTGCTSAEQKKEYRNAQVSVISTQVDARARENSADAAARIALYSAMAEVARTSPASADAIAVAMAISSVKEESASGNPIVQLHKEQNEAIEVVKAVAPALIATAGTIAVAGYQASVSKNNSDNAALVALGESGKDADIMRSVTNMASVGLNRETVSVGGDYTTVGNDMDQSVTTTTSSTKHRIKLCKQRDRQ
jgi:aspartate/glutamate racemase